MDEVEAETLKYLNRLSDFLFTLARHAAKLDGKAEHIYVRPGEHRCTLVDATSNRPLTTRPRQQASRQLIPNVYALTTRPLGHQ